MTEDRKAVLLALCEVQRARRVALVAWLDVSDYDERARLRAIYDEQSRRDWNELVLAAGGGL